MRYLLICFTILGIISCKKEGNTNFPIIPAETIDSFKVTVNNGFGAGMYKTGDTVHIFSAAYSTDQVFDKWAGNISNLQNPEEWHTWFIMPHNNISISGTIKNIAAFDLQYEQIRGRDRLKPVYSYFPLNHKGIVYFFHGSGGSAQSVITNYEFLQLLKVLVNDGFGVIITEAEEATTGIDANADGKLRWSTYPVDTLLNVDYVNIRNITDTFYNRGITNRAIPRYSIGMSNGGAYSAALSFAYNFKAGISYCAPGGAIIAQATSVPFQFCMARFDNNENVGPQGNADALANYNTLTARGICSKFFIKERSPLYAERFARRGDIPVASSKAIFTELKNNGFIDSKNHFIGYSSALITAFQANPALFPQINSLTLLQISFVVEQINLAVSDHEMYSDYNKATLRFLNTQCL